MSAKTIAVFDMDGTITSRDTFLEFIIFAKGERKYRLGFLWLSPAVVLYLLKIYPNYKLKELVFTWFYKGFDNKELHELGKKFSTEVVPKMCYDGAMQKIEWHKQMGHRVIILTASSPIWLGKWCKDQGLELIGTNFEVVDGKLTGKIDGENCHGKKKREILEKILEQGQYDDSYGYGNSPSDSFFLELVNQKHMGGFEKTG